MRDRPQSGGCKPLQFTCCYKSDSASRCPTLAAEARVHHEHVAAFCTNFRGLISLPLLWPLLCYRHSSGSTCQALVHTFDNLNWPEDSLPERILGGRKLHGD